MASIRASVGLKGVNKKEDVKIVQKLLQGHTLKTVKNIDTDGLVGPITIKAIKEFQHIYVGLRYPDCIVDPGGKTIKKLNQFTQKSSITPEQKEQAATPQEKRLTRINRDKFIRPQVKESRVTAQIIDKIYPHFDGIRATVISGYLNDSDLYWKVNYHWDYLLWMVKYSIGLGISAQDQGKLEAIKGRLLSCKPDPPDGYRTSPIGTPKDRSSSDEFDRRYKILGQAKRDLKTIVQNCSLKSKSKRDPKCFDLAVAPVARPGKSKHSTGYALDIEGDNMRIKSICKNLGASLVFDEKSHIHVEFANGVN